MILSLLASIVTLAEIRINPRSITPANLDLTPEAAYRKVREIATNLGLDAEAPVVVMLLEQSGQIRTWECMIENRASYKMEATSGVLVRYLDDTRSPFTPATSDVPFMTALTDEQKILARLRELLLAAGARAEFRIEKLRNKNVSSTGRYEPWASLFVEFTHKGRLVLGKGGLYTLDLRDGAPVYIQQDTRFEVTHEEPALSQEHCVDLARIEYLQRLEGAQAQPYSPDRPADLFYLPVSDEKGDPRVTITYRVFFGDDCVYVDATDGRVRMVKVGKR